MAGTIQAGTITDGTNSVTTQQITKGTVRAWVCFDATTSPITIKDAFNVASITDNGIGYYTINFTNPMPSLNYIFAGTGKTRAENDFSALLDQRNTDIKTLSQCAVRVQVNGSGQAPFDSKDMGVIFVGG